MRTWWWREEKEEEEEEEEEEWKERVSLSQLAMLDDGRECAHCISLIHTHRLSLTHTHTLSLSLSLSLSHSHLPIVNDNRVAPRAFPEPAVRVPGNKFSNVSALVHVSCSSQVSSSSHVSRLTHILKSQCPSTFTI